MPDGNSPSKARARAASPAEQLRQRLARGPAVGDEELDALLPQWVQHLSKVHWTPVAVAQIAARFLVEGRGTTANVLDVGSGAGKFCTVAAATTGARFTGIERRAPLVRVATALARTLDLDNARFVCGPMEDLDWTGFTGVYLFNPFGEHFIDACESIDGKHVGWSLYVHFVRSAIARLYLMPTGTRVVTYHGIGGPMPPGYELVDSQIHGCGSLRFYVRLDPALVETRRPPRDLFDEDLLDDITQDMRVPPRPRGPLEDL